MTDASGNTADRTVTVQVVDEADPIFSGPALYSIGYDVNLTVSDIKARIVRHGRLRSRSDVVDLR
ncbi:MAG: hypothetical protein MZU97_14495 [Bacillus subtilis]|nr:hypothetical protein [Bacillus subtilis]